MLRLDWKRIEHRSHSQARRFLFMFIALSMFALTLQAIQGLNSKVRGESARALSVTSPVFSEEMQQLQHFGCAQLQHFGCAALTVHFSL